MGFTTGFTGGVTLTLTIAYLSVLAHQRNRETQGDLLRAQAQILHALAQQSSNKQPGAIVLPTDAAAAATALPPPPTRAELAALRRAGFVSSVKDAWNDEVAGAVRWVQDTDNWDGLREGAEAAAGRAWSRLVGGTGADQKVDEVKGRVEEAGRGAVAQAKGAVADAQTSVAAAARGALQQTEDRAAQARDVLGQKAGEARGVLSQKAGETGDVLAKKAREAKETSRSVIDRGVEKGGELLSRAKAAVVGAEEDLGAKVATAKATESDVERALRQRYETRRDALSRSVEEVLRERYRPIDERDNWTLRGV